MVLSFIHIEEMLRILQNIPRTHVMLLKILFKGTFFWFSQDRKDQENDAKIRYCLRSYNIYKMSKGRKQ